MKNSLKYLLLTGIVLVSAGCNQPSTSESLENNSTPEVKPTPTPSTPDSSTPDSSTPDSSTPDSSTSIKPSSPSDSSTDVIVPPELIDTDLYVVGDSTLCSFTDSTYFYPRYGYGTQLGNYLNEKVAVKNLALSGRSSKSFTQEENYQVLKDNLSQGDFLLIGFGHNDEKNDDVSRFTDASKPTSDSSSFKYSLYENYIKLAESKGAIPILATPIVRASKSNDYNGSNGHVTSTGDYRKAIIELGEEKDISVVDLTTLTKNYYTEIGYAEAIYLHAMTSGISATEANINSVDTTHLNVYGAKMVAYMFANALLSLDCPLSSYIDESNLIKPIKENDLIQNPDYVYSGYSSPNLENYVAADQFRTLTDGWYGTAFGDTGGDPNSQANGYIAKETSAGVFKVGQYLDSGSNKGKFSSTSDGLAYLFKQVDASKNFTLTAKAKVLTAANTKQAGFGLMLRDDVYLPIKDASVKGNFIAGGFLCDSSSMTAIFTRDSDSKITKSNNSISSLYVANDEAIFTIERLGQKVTVTVEYKGNTYKEEYLDFPLTSKDTEYMYIGMFANRGTTVEFTNVVFTITGDAIEA